MQIFTERVSWIIVCVCSCRYRKPGYWHWQRSCYGSTSRSDSVRGKLGSGIHKAPYNDRKLKGFPVVKHDLDTELNPYWESRADLAIDSDGTILRNGRLLVPRPLRREVLKASIHLIQDNLALCSGREVVFLAKYVKGHQKHSSLGMETRSVTGWCLFVCCLFHIYLEKVTQQTFVVYSKRTYLG